MNSILKNKKRIKFTLYVIFLLIFLFITYLLIPKLLNFSIESIKINLKNNNNINIRSISKVHYKVFPTPRLIIPNSTFTIGKKIIEVNNSELEIILKLSEIFNYKKINYKKLLINNGSSKIKLNNINQLLTDINKNKKELIFKKNNIIFFQNKKVFFTISNALIKVDRPTAKKILTVNGNFLNNKIFIKLSSTLKNKNNLIIKIPSLDISTNVFFEKNKSGNINGIFNLEIFNNFLKFNFIKKNNIKLIDGFLRSELINSSFEGEIMFNPNFFSKLDFKTSYLNKKKLFLLVKKNYFSDKSNNLSLIKKFNGIFNFKSKFSGRITNNNGEILFKDFKVGKDKSLYFDARIIEFGKKGKVQFNLIKTFEYKRNLSKKIVVKGFLIPSNSNIIFEEFSINGIELSAKKVKEYENKFEDELIQNYLGNIFSENKIDKYFKSLF
jgi:hypothetical protein